jgi:hypothetical protein
MEPGWQLELGLACLLLAALGRLLEGLRLAWLLGLAHRTVSLMLLGAGDSLHDWQDTKILIAFGVIGVFIVFYSIETNLDFNPYLALNFALELCLTFLLLSVALLLLRAAKLHRSRCGADRILERNPYNMGRVLARTTFSFLENVLKGQGQTGDGSFRHVLQHHREKEQLERGTSFYPKLVVPFPEPEWDQSRPRRPPGSVADLVGKEREPGACHTLTTEKISYRYTASGGVARTAQLEVLKCRSAGRVTYLAYSENRALNTLHQMVLEPCIGFGPAAFSTELQLYLRALRRLLEADPACRERCLLLHYREGPGALTHRVLGLLDRWIHTTMGHRSRWQLIGTRQMAF